MTERRVGRAAARPRVEVAGPEGEDAPATSRGRITTTMAEYGEKLPVGILDGNNTLHKNLAIKPWRTKDEIELGRKIAPDASMQDHIALVVSNMCTRLGPYDMTALDDGQRQLRISQMYMADVFYAYTWLRRSVMGSKLKLKEVGCSRAGCGVTFPYTGDIDSLEVVAVDNIDDIIWVYELENPIQVRGETVTRFHMAYPKWQVMNRARGETNVAEIKLYAILESIIGVNEGTKALALTENELDDLSKPDFEALQEGIEEHVLGPKMSIEGKCTPAVCERFKRGGFEFKYPIDWRFQNFFGASSR